MRIRQKISFDYICVICYKLLLDYAYTHIQVPLFGYNGFANDGGVSRIIVGWIVYLFVYAVIAQKESDTSSLFSYVVFFVSISPFISLYQYDSQCGLWMLISQSICLIYINILLSFGRHKRFLRGDLKGVNYKSRKLRSFVFILVLGYFGFALLRFGIPNVRSLLFEEVYNTRAEANLSTFQSIIQNVVCRIVCPISMLVMFREKKWVLFSILAIVQLYTYSVTGFKTYLFIPIVLLGLHFLPNLNLKKTIIRGLPIALLMLVVLYSITKSTMLYAVLGNRVFFLPAKIKYAYFDYFQKNPFVYFSQNSISKILGIRSNYDTNIVYLIGEAYFNKPSMWTNTGFMADAYANLGFIGMALMGSVIAIVLNVLNKQMRYVASDLQKEIQAIFVTFYISLNDGATISVLFSGGMLLAVLIVCYVKFYDRSRFERISL